MKKQAKLYKEYLTWVKSKNKAGLAHYKKFNAELWKNYEEQRDKQKKKYKTKLKKWKKKEQDKNKDILEFKSLPWYKKIFMENPEHNSDYFWLEKPLDFSWMIMPPFTLYIPEEVESYEGFMKWLSEVKYK